MDHEQVFLIMVVLGLVVGAVLAFRRRAKAKYIVLAVFLQLVTVYAVAIMDALTQNNFFVLNAFLLIPFAIYLGRPVRNLLQTYFFIYGICYIFPAFLILTGRFYF